MPLIYQGSPRSVQVALGLFVIVVNGLVYWRLIRRSPAGNLSSVHWPFIGAPSSTN